MGANPEDLTSKADKISVQLASIRQAQETETNTRERQVRLLRIASVLMAAAIAAQLVLGMFVAVNFQHDSQRQQDQAKDLCKVAQENRNVMQKMVFLAFNQEGRSGMDFSSFPGYNDLDPATKAWVDELNRVAGSNRPGAGENGEPRRGDENGNSVPDVIEELLAEPVCPEQPE